MAARARIPPLAIICSIGLATCFIDVDSEERPTPAPYKMEFNLSTPLLEPLQLYFADAEDNVSAETGACRSHARAREPVFSRRFSAEPGQSAGRSGGSCELSPPAPMATFSWSDTESRSGHLGGSYWQLQKFRPASATLVIHGNSGRLTSVSIALDSQAPIAVVSFSKEGTWELESADSREVRVVSVRVQPPPASSDADLLWYDFEAELRIEFRSAQLAEGPHQLSITISSPEITGVRTTTREPDQPERWETVPATEFTYTSCFDVLLNATDLRTAPDGALWIGTFEGGLLKADLGRSRERSDDDVITFFEGDSVDTGPIEMKAVTGPLAGNSITRLAFDPQGHLWVGSLFHDFTVMREGHFTQKYDIPDVDEFEFDMNMLVGDTAKLTRYLNQELSDTVTGFAFLSEHDVMIGTLNGLYYLDHKGTLADTSDDTWQRFDHDDGLGDVNIIGLAADKDGLLWIATTDLSDEDRPEENDGEGLYVLDMKGTPAQKSDDRWANFTPDDGGFDERVLTFAIDADGGKWLAAIGGLFYLDDGGTPFDKSDDKWAKFGAADGFIDEDVSSIRPLGPGTYLIGTVDILSSEPNTPPGGALIYMRLVGKPYEKNIRVLVNYTINDGFTDADVSSLDLDKFGRVAFSSFNFFHSPIVMSLYAMVETPPTSPSAGLSGGSGAVSQGRDGVSFVDLGVDETSKADDQIVNLISRHIRLTGKRL